MRGRQFGPDFCVYCGPVLGVFVCSLWIYFVDLPRFTPGFAEIVSAKLSILLEVVCRRHLVSFGLWRVTRYIIICGVHSFYVPKRHLVNSKCQSIKGPRHIEGTLLEDPYLQCAIQCFETKSILTFLPSARGSVPPGRKAYFIKCPP